MPSADPVPFSHPLRVARLNPRKPTDLDILPDDEALARIALALDLVSLPSARLTGRIAAAPNGVWRLDGRLTAQVVQPCVVTLAPVETAIDEPVSRLYSPHAADRAPGPVGTEVEMTDDETEPLGQVIDPGAVLIESLSLALPLYPRAPDAARGASPDGAGGADGPASADDVRRPFAGLADLLARRDG